MTSENYAFFPIKWENEAENGKNCFFSEKNYLKYSGVHRELLERLRSAYQESVKSEESLKSQNSSNNKSVNEDNLKSSNNKLDITLAVESKRHKSLDDGKIEKKQSFGFIDASERYPKFSSLSPIEHTQYLTYFHKYSGQTIMSPTEEERKEINILANLHSKVVLEQKEYMEYVKNKARLKKKDYSYIHAEAKRYIEERLKEKLQYILTYSRYYVVSGTVNYSPPIVPIKDPVNLKYLSTVLEMGKIPRLVLPSPDIPCFMSLDYLKMCKRFSPKIAFSNTSHVHPSKLPVSRDSIAEQLAEKHEVDFVLSLATLKTLMDFHPDSNRPWEMPISVKVFKKSLPADVCIICRQPAQDTENNIKCTGICGGLFHFQCAGKTVAVFRRLKKNQKQKWKCNKCKNFELGSETAIEKEETIKQIFLDKPIPRGNFTPRQKNALYHKYAVKLQFTHFNPTKLMRSKPVINESASFDLSDIQNKIKRRSILNLNDNCFSEDKADICSQETFGTIAEATNDIKSLGIPIGDSNPGMQGISVNSSLYDCHQEMELVIDPKMGILEQDLQLSESSSSHVNTPPANTEKCMDEELKLSSSCKDSVNGSTKIDEMKELTSSDEHLKDLHQVADQQPLTSTDKEGSSENNTSKERRITRSQTKLKEFTPGRVTSSLAKKTLTKTRKLSPKDAKHSEKQEQMADKPEKLSKNAVCGTVKTRKRAASESIEEMSKNKIGKDEGEGPRKRSSSPSIGHKKSPTKRIVYSSDEESDKLVIDEEGSCNKDVKEDDKKLKVQLQRIDDSNNSTQANAEIIKMDTGKCSDTNTDLNPIQKETSVSVSDHPKKESINSVSEASPLDTILQLQEEMLKPKAANASTPTVGSISQPQKTQTDEFKEYSTQLISPSSTDNATYSLWSLGSMKLLLRTKLDCKKSPGNNPWLIFSKIEYQSQYGAEVTTPSELVYQWLSLLVHPGSRLLKVRVNALTSELLMMEEMGLSDLLLQAGKFQPECAIQLMHTVLSQLKELQEGNYLLVHKGNENVLTVHHAADIRKRGAFDLHTAINQKIVSLDEPILQNQYIESPWYPLDPDVMLPSFAKCNRIPLTYPPKSVLFRNGDLPKWQKHKKKKKKKKES